MEASDEGKDAQEIECAGDDWGAGSDLFSSGRAMAFGLAERDPGL